MDTRKIAAELVAMAKELTAMGGDIELVEKRGAPLEDKPRYMMVFRGAPWGELYFNMHGYVAERGIPVPRGDAADAHAGRIGVEVAGLQIGEQSLSKFKSEISKANREWAKWPKVVRVASSKMARHTEAELRELYREMSRSREPGLQGLMALVSHSIWDIDKVNWGAVRRELGKLPSGPRTARAMEALPRFKDIEAGRYEQVKAELGATTHSDSPEFLRLVKEWELFERDIVQPLESEMVEYYMGPGRAELRTASSVTAAALNFDSAQEFVDYLQDTLIPDLEESGSDATAEDFEKVCKLIDAGRRDGSFVSYLKGTLIPDLKASGMLETAKDFEEGIHWMAHAK